MTTSLHFTFHSSQLTLISHYSFSNVATQCKLIIENLLKTVNCKLIIERRRRV
jgi:hypothetical protein